MACFRQMETKAYFKNSKKRANLGCDGCSQKYGNICIGLWRALLGVRIFTYWATEVVDLNT